MSLGCPNLDDLQSIVNRSAYFKRVKRIEEEIMCGAEWDEYQERI